MSTPYQDIYNRFFYKITDYQLADMDEQELNNLLKGYLMSAITDFDICEKDLTNYDNDYEEFAETLSDLEKEILATLLVKQWLQPIIYSINLLQQRLSSRDWRIYSQAAHVKEVLELKKHNEAEIERLIIKYSYSTGDLGDLA